ncbi:unnamed protein product, partial [Polarella glacialis]
SYGESDALGSRGHPAARPQDPQRFMMRGDIDGRSRQDAGFQERRVPVPSFFDNDAIAGTVEAACRPEVERRLAALQGQRPSVVAQLTAEVQRLLVCRRRYAS